MTMKNKGFTIVELAIVLVVIGLILTMSVKGKALVEVTRYNMEAAKIRNMEVYLHSYDAAVEGDIKLTGSDGCDLYVDMEAMMAGGIFTQEDITSFFMGWSSNDSTDTGNLMYSYKLGSSGIGYVGPVLCDNAASDMYKENRYVWLSPSHNFDLDTSEYEFARVNWKYACKMEALIDEGAYDGMVDDGMLFTETPGHTGRVRVLAEGNSLSGYTAADFEDCNIIPATAGGDGLVFRPMIYMGSIF